MVRSLLFLQGNGIKHGVSNQLLISLCFIAATFVISIPLILMTGCNMKNPLVLEMEAAYNLPSASSTESNKNVALMIKNHFPKGMKISDALSEIHKNDFLIIENKRDGSRKWPDGEFKPYAVEEVRRNIQNTYTEKQINYYSKFTYWASPLEKRETTISIETDDGLITNSRGAIYSYTF